jgi:hypothetical protein
MPFMSPTKLLLQKVDEILNEEGARSPLTYLQKALGKLEKKATSR